MRRARAAPAPRAGRAPAPRRSGRGRSRPAACSAFALRSVWVAGQAASPLFRSLYDLTQQPGSSTLARPLALRSWPSLCARFVPPPPDANLIEQTKRNRPRARAPAAPAPRQRIAPCMLPPWRPARPPVVPFTPSPRARTPQRLASERAPRHAACALKPTADLRQPPRCKTEHKRGRPAGAPLCARPPARGGGSEHAVAPPVRRGAGVARCARRRSSSSSQQPAAAVESARKTRRPCRPCLSFALAAPRSGGPLRGSARRGRPRLASAPSRRRGGPPRTHVYTPTSQCPPQPHTMRAMLGRTALHPRACTSVRFAQCPAARAPPGNPCPPRAAAPGPCRPIVLLPARADCARCGEDAG